MSIYRFLRGVNLIKDDLCLVDICTTNSILREVKCFHSCWEKRRYFKIARRDEVFVGSTRVIFTIPMGTRVTSACFIASQV